MSNKSEMTFLQHLEELRWHLFRGVVAIFAVAIAAFLFKDFLFDKIILAPGYSDFPMNRLMCHLADYTQMHSLCINKVPLKFQNISMSGQFTTHIWVSFVAGFIVAFPYIFWELWWFIKPALHENEQKVSRGAIGVVSLLFIVGVLFGYYMIMPFSLDFLGTYKVSESVENIITLDSYISTLTGIVLASGVLFEMPVLIYFLAKIGLVSSSFLRKYRRHAIVVVVILAAVITPPDVVSQIMVCVPLVFLYEISILVAKNLERKRAKA